MRYHTTFPKKHTSTSKRWVLLEHIPTILTPKILLLIFVYSVAFTLLVVGLKLFSLERNTSLPHDARVSIADTAHIQSDIAKNIVRLHVIANSDTDLDQNLKLKVRDEIISSLQASLKNANSVGQAKEIIASRQGQIQLTAQNVLSQNNCPYPVSVSLSKRYFPVKQYGDLSFPAGTYDALCVEIGNAAGHNWWCVLFPSLCFVNETTATVPDSSKKKLQESLSAEEYAAISQDETATPAPTDMKSKKTHDSSEKRPILHSGLLDLLRK